jgi:hypothetical protein
MKLTGKDWRATKEISYIFLWRNFFDGDNSWTTVIDKKNL